MDLNVSNESAVLIERGRAFHRTGDALLNVRFPQEEQVMGSRSKWPSVSDLRARDGRDDRFENVKGWILQIKNGPKCRSFNYRTILGHSTKVFFGSSLKSKKHYYKP